MIATETLATTDDLIGPIVVPRDHFVSAGVQYGAGGAGTIALQGTLNDTDWVAIPMSADGGVTFVLLTAAAGIWSADVSMYSQVRVKCTVAGAGVVASLALSSV